MITLNPLLSKLPQAIVHFPAYAKSFWGNKFHVKKYQFDLWELEINPAGMKFISTNSRPQKTIGNILAFKRILMKILSE